MMRSTASRRRWCAASRARDAPSPPLPSRSRSSRRRASPDEDDLRRLPQRRAQRQRTYACSVPTRAGSRRLVVPVHVLDRSSMVMMWYACVRLISLMIAASVVDLPGARRTGHEHAPFFTRDVHSSAGIFSTQRRPALGITRRTIAYVPRCMTRSAAARLLRDRYDRSTDPLLSTCGSAESPRIMCGRYLRLERSQARQAGEREAHELPVPPPPARTADREVQVGHALETLSMASRMRRIEVFMGG